MNLYTTKIIAVSPHDGRLIKFCGPNVPGISFEDAQNYCETHELGYCKVDGLLVAEIPCKENSYEPDFSRMIEYDKQRIN